MYFKPVLLILSITAIVAGSVAAQDADNADNATELKRLEGRFERTFTNAAGTLFRSVKDVGDGKSIVVTYDDVGNVVEAHESEFKIQRHGPTRVFSFYNLVVTAGPNKGHRQLETNSYVYRIDGDTIIEAWGLLESDPNPPRMFAWKRVKSP
jgi:hypothetical protein